MYDEIFAALKKKIKVVFFRNKNKLLILPIEVPVDLVYFNYLANHMFCLRLLRRRGDPCKQIVHFRG